MTDRLQKILLELKGRLTEIYGERLERVMLFGSQARGDAEPDSDIDVLVVLKGAVNDGREIIETGGIAAAISLAYKTVISCVFISSDKYARGEEPLLWNVKREGITL